MCLPEIAPTLGVAPRVPELALDIRIDPKSFLLVYRMRKLRMFRKPKFLGRLHWVVITSFPPYIYDHIEYHNKILFFGKK